MGINILTEYSDRVRYTLSSKTFGTKKIQDQIGWDDDEKEFVRNKENHGVFTNLSNSLQFTKEAKDFIYLVDATEGVNADLILSKEEKNDYSDEWELSYTGFLDLSTLEEQDNKASLKFNAGGLESILKNREGEDVEVDRILTIDDKAMDSLKTVNVQLSGRRIYLESTWKASPMTYYKQILVQSSGGNTRDASNTFPMDIMKKSHEQANSTYDGMDGNFSNGAGTMMLLSIMDRKRIVKVNTQGIVLSAYSYHNGGVNWGEVRISIIKYTDGSNYRRLEGTGVNLYQRSFANNETLGLGTITLPDITHEFTLEQGESLGLEVLIRVDFKLNPGNTTKRSFDYKLQEGKITIQEDSVFAPTVCKAIKPFDLANRLVEILTNRKNAVKSEILQSGKWKSLLVSHGFWIRGFSKEMDTTLNEEDRKFKPLTTNFKDFMTSLAAVCNIGWGIEKIGAREYVVIEDLKYFYNRNTAIRLPFQAKNVKRSTDAAGFYKSVEIGFEKGGDYEEAMGLDEYNIRNTYTTCIHRVENTYTKLSKYRSDSYGVEFARRKPFSDYATEDTNYDQDIFFLDCKDQSTIINVPVPPFRGETRAIEVFKLRLWNEDFATMPTGVFSPETAFNLRLSPFNILLRHGWMISSGLTKYPSQKIKYASSKGNSNLVTDYAENGEIENSKLERPRFVPKIIEFEHECTSDVLRMIQGRSIVLGKEIRNCYCLVEFINENGEYEKGFLMSVKPNGAGNWKLLKYNN